MEEKESGGTINEELSLFIDNLSDQDLAILKDFINIPGDDSNRIIREILALTNKYDFDSVHGVIRRVEQIRDQFGLGYDQMQKLILDYLINTNFQS